MQSKRQKIQKKEKTGKARYIFKWQIYIYMYISYNMTYCKSINVCVPLIVQISRVVANCKLLWPWQIYVRKLSFNGILNSTSQTLMDTKIFGSTVPTIMATITEYDSYATLLTATD